MQQNRPVEVRAQPEVRHFVCHVVNIVHNEEPGAVQGRQHVYDSQQLLQSHHIQAWGKVTVFWLESQNHYEAWYRQGTVNNSATDIASRSMETHIWHSSAIATIAKHS